MNNFIKIIISSREKDSEEPFKINESPDANPVYTGFKAIQNNRKIKIINGGIFPCKEGDIKISWDNEFYKNKKRTWKQKKKVIAFLFKNLSYSITIKKNLCFQKNSRIHLIQHRENVFSYLPLFSAYFVPGSCNDFPKG